MGRRAGNDCAFQKLTALTPQRISAVVLVVGARNAQAQTSTSQAARGTIFRDEMNRCSRRTKAVRFLLRGTVMLRIHLGRPVSSGRDEPRSPRTPQARRILSLGRILALSHLNCLFNVDRADI
jgi:hypothetical protein